MDLQSKTSIILLLKSLLRATSTVATWRKNFVEKGVSMTTNQVAYARLQEEKRHNLATEEETQRSNKFRETEDQRHNFASEAIGNRQTDVNEQHYVRSDSINDIGTLGNIAHMERSDKEQKRHNLASENVDMLGIGVQQERNRITEKNNDAQVFLKGQEIAVQAARVQNDFTLGKEANAIKQSEVKGKLNIAYQKLPSEIELDEAKSKQSEAQASKTAYDTVLTKEQALTERTKRAKTAADVDKTKAATQRDIAETEYGKWTTIFKGVDSFAKVADSFGKIINGGKKK